MISASMHDCGDGVFWVIISIFSTNMAGEARELEFGFNDIFSQLFEKVSL